MIPYGFLGAIPLVLGDSRILESEVARHLPT